MISQFELFKRIITTARINIVATDLEPDDMLFLHCLMNVLRKKAKYIKIFIQIFTLYAIFLQIYFKMDLLVQLLTIFIAIFVYYITKSQLIIIVGQGNAEIKRARVKKYVENLKDVDVHIFRSASSIDYFVNDGKGYLTDYELENIPKMNKAEMEEVAKKGNKGDISKFIMHNQADKLRDLLHRLTYELKIFGSPVVSFGMNIFIIKPICDVILSKSLRPYIKNSKCYVYGGWNIASAIPKKTTENNRERDSKIEEIIDFFNCFPKYSVTILENERILKNNGFLKTVTNDNESSIDLIRRMRYEQWSEGNSGLSMRTMFGIHVWQWNTHFLRYMSTLIDNYLNSTKVIDNYLISEKKEKDDVDEKENAELRRVSKRFSEIYAIHRHVSDKEIKESQELFKLIPEKVIKNYDTYKSVVAFPEMQFTFADLHVFIALIFPELYMYQCDKVGIDDKNFLNPTTNNEKTFYARIANNLNQLPNIKTNEEKWKNLLMHIKFSI